MKHKGYEAVVGYDEDDKIFTGRVIDTQDVIAFDGASVAELETAFQAVIDEYLEDCTRIGKQPNKPFSGKFVVRIPPEDHRAAVVAAGKAGVSLNAWAADALKKAAHEERAKRRGRGHPLAGPCQLASVTMGTSRPALERVDSRRWPVHYYAPEFSFSGRWRRS